MSKIFAKTIALHVGLNVQNFCQDYSLTCWLKCPKFLPRHFDIILYRAHTEPGKAGQWAIFTKSQGKPEIVRGISVIFIQVMEKSWKTHFFGPHITVIDSCVAVC